MQCSLIETCISSAKHQKIVTWHVCDNLMNELEHQCLTALNREIYKKIKQTIERVFANAKKHGIRWKKYRELEKVAT